MKKTYVKHFEYEGQMINYYNKLRTNTSIAYITFCYEAGEGYILKYRYK